VMVTVTGSFIFVYWLFCFRYICDIDAYKSSKIQSFRKTLHQDGVFQIKIVGSANIWQVCVYILNCHQKRFNNAVYNKRN
jgi:hypothetical protein